MKFSTLLKGFGIFAAAMSNQVQAQAIYSNFTVCNNYPVASGIDVIVFGDNIHSDPEYLSLRPQECGEVNPQQCIQTDAYTYECASNAQKNGNQFSIGGWTAFNNSLLEIFNSAPWNGCIGKNSNNNYSVNPMPAHASSCPPALKK